MLPILVEQKLQVNFKHCAVCRLSLHDIFSLVQNKLEM